jgi:signal transduction histidine kinase
MTRLVEDIIQSSRRIAAELRPGVLDDLGLVAAIEWEVQHFHARTGIKSQVTLPKEEIALGPECSVAMFRVLQER